MLISPATRALEDLRMAATPQGSPWPGERDPTHQEVVSANERLDPALLFDFKSALLSSGDADGSVKLLQTGFVNQAQLVKSYTYPLALLSQFPKLPPEDRISFLHQNFSKFCLNHVFFEHYPIPMLTREPVAPPLRYGAACLASLCTSGDNEQAEALFSAGSSLWTVIIEVDNGLARSIDMLLAAVLLVPYGVLATTDTLRKRSTLVLSGSLTVARRMRLHTQLQLDSNTRQRISPYSSMLWSLWLWDILHALHSNLSLNFASNEILSSMPSSTVAFQDVYRDMLQEFFGGNQLQSLALGDGSRDQAMLLLLAILSDAVTVRRSLGSASNVINAAKAAVYCHNPFATNFAHTELERMQGQLSIALDRWFRKFDGFLGQDIIALYHYCRLYISCSAIHKLAELADHELSAQKGSPVAIARALPGVVISDRAVSHAWAVLDSAAIYPKSRESLCSAWMPIVVFHASLVVWARVTLDSAGDRQRHSSKRALIAFKMELEGMHWPCCASMAATLHRLMST